MPVKNSRQEFLLLLLNDIENGLMLTQIARHLGKSKQALNYHIKRLRRNGLITKVQSYPYAIYSITPFGKRVKENYRYPDNMNSWRCHALQVGFRIEDFGSYNFIENPRRSISSMNGWKYTSEQIDQHHVKIQDTGLMIVSCPDIYTSNPDEAWAKMYQQAAQIANNYINKYSMKLKPMQIIRRGQKSLVGSEVLAKLFGKGKISKEVWIDASGGTDEIETFQDSHAIEKLLAMPDILDNRLVPAIEQHSRDIQMHMTVLGEMRDAIRELRDAVRETR